jgi:hypothetical protein
MSRNHQGNRRRAYGRRQHELHELHERTERGHELLDLHDDHAAPSVVAAWRPGLSPRAFAGGWLPVRGVD